MSSIVRGHHLFCSLSLRHRVKRPSLKTLDGRRAYAKHFSGAREAREVLKQYENTDGLEVHGYERFLYQHINQKFPTDIDYNMSMMKIYTIDIEVACENGFPDVQASAEECCVLQLKISITKKVVTWGTKRVYSSRRCRV